MEIWEKGGYIFIKVNAHFNYSIQVSRIKSIGDEKDPPGDFTMWGWVNHLRDKNWWHPKIERSFIEICKTIIKE